MYMTAAYVGEGDVSRSGRGTAEKPRAVRRGTVGDGHAWRISTDGWARTEEARALLSEVLSRGDAAPYYIALAYAGLGRTTQAFMWLDKTLQRTRRDRSTS